MEELSQAIADYIEQRKQTKLEPLQKARNKILANTKDDAAIAQANLDYAAVAKPIEDAYLPSVWLSDAAKRAKQISLATHAAKFTHSDAKASSVLVTAKDDSHNVYLATNKLKDKSVDVVGNAAALDVAKLLKITVNNDNLIQQLQRDCVDALKPFTDNDVILEEWRQGFEKSLLDEKLSSHNFSKQLYFPVGAAADEYHLLCPLFSSALTHQLHASVNLTRFGDSKDIRDARRKEILDERLDENFPATAVQNFGGTKPQNISQLNSERYGYAYLLKAAPPQYQRQISPPIKSRSLFDRELNYRTRNLVGDFKSFLANLSDKDKNFSTRYKRDFNFIQPIIDTLLNYAAEVQSLTEYAGWASLAECNLKDAHCLWLDVANQHPKFQAEREKGDWLEVVVSDFSNWLIAKLNYKNDVFKVGDIENAYFKKLCLQELKAFERATTITGASA